MTKWHCPTKERSVQKDAQEYSLPLAQHYITDLAPEILTSLNPIEGYLGDYGFLLEGDSSRLQDCGMGLPAHQSGMEYGSPISALSSYILHMFAGNEMMMCCCCTYTPCTVNKHARNSVRFQ